MRPWTDEISHHSHYAGVLSADIVDEGWSSYRDANGNITGNARFPAMKALADYVHSKGLKIGIYSRAANLRRLPG